MVIAVIMIGYVIGFISSYRLIRKMVKYKTDGDWLLLEKLVTIVLSLFSWAMLIGILMLISPLFRKLDLDKNCKW